MVNYIVSGCPRSGTSLMMQILNNSGLNIAKDDKRKADNDNKHGYFEIDNIISRLKKDPLTIFKFDDKVVKVTHFGIQYLPEGDYKIIYLERDIEEVLDSMEKMMGKGDENRQETKRIFVGFNDKVKKHMEGRADIKYLLINYKKLLTNSEKELDKIINFFGINSSMKEKMMSSIDKKSYRNRR